jgi:hypothetical protein
MSAHVRTTALLPASPEAVFAVLADFARYAEWNPLNVEADGEVRLGARVRMRALNPLQPGRPQAMTVTITRCEPGRALEWVGAVPLLFRGRHAFVLSPEAGGTRLEHSEELSGLLPLLWGRRRIAALWPPHYEALNVALAKRVAT